MKNREVAIYADQRIPKPAPAVHAGQARVARRTGNARRAAALAAALFGVASIGIGAWFALTRTPRPPTMAPEVAFTAIDGRELTLAGMRGKVVLVDFWATSCVICVKELPEIARIHRRLEARGLVTIAVAMPYDRPDYVLHYVRRNALPFPVALDPMGRVVDALGPVRGTPTLLLIDRAGRVVERVEGGSDLAALERRIERELGRAALDQAALAYSATSTRLPSGSRK